MMPVVDIKIDVHIPEQLLTQDKKSIIYRIIKDTLRMLALHEHDDGEIRIILGFNDTTGNLQLSIHAANEKRRVESYEPADFDLMKEKTILSGGEFSITSDSAGGIKAISEWENR
jgi:signal transduction histidine kinase